MKVNKEILKELAEISPRMAEIENEVEFKIPEQYFENLSTLIMNKLDQKQIYLKHKRIIRWQVYSVAAVLAVIVSFSFWKYGFNNKNDLYKYLSSEDYILSNCSEAFLLEYMEENQLNMEDDKYSDIDIEQFDTDLLIEEL